MDIAADLPVEQEFPVDGSRRAKLRRPNPPLQVGEKSQLPSNPAGIAKAEREVAEFRTYRQLSQQFVEVNTRICELRPVAETRP